MTTTMVEGSSLLRSGSRRRAVLAANADTCDLYVYGADRCLRMFHPKAASGALRGVTQLRPQLLDPFFVRDIAPSFWQESPEAQERIVRAAQDQARRAVLAPPAGTAAAAAATTTSITVGGGRSNEEKAVQNVLRAGRGSSPARGGFRLS